MATPIAMTGRSVFSGRSAGPRRAGAATRTPSGARQRKRGRKQSGSGHMAASVKPPVFTDGGSGGTIGLPASDILKRDIRSRLVAQQRAARAAAKHGGAASERAASSSRPKVPPLTLRASDGPHKDAGPAEEPPPTAIQQSRNMLWEELIKADAAQFELDQTRAAMARAAAERRNQASVRRQMEERRAARLAEAAEDKPYREKLESEAKQFQQQQREARLLEMERLRKLKQEQDEHAALKHKQAQAQAAADRSFEERALESARLAAEYINTEQDRAAREKQAWLLKAKRESEEAKRAAAEAKAKEEAEVRAMASGSLDRVVVGYFERDAARKAQVKAREARQNAILQRVHWVGADEQSKDKTVAAFAKTGQRKKEQEFRDRLRLEKLKAKEINDELVRTREMQVKQRQLQRALEEQEELAFAARCRQDAVAAEAYVTLRADREAAKKEQLKRELDAQLSEMQAARARGVNRVGDGVSDTEWAMNRALHRSLSATAPLGGPGRRDRTPGRVLPAGTTRASTTRSVQSGSNPPFHVDEDERLKPFRRSAEGIPAEILMKATANNVRRPKPTIRWYD